jgi:hypothetical protein
VDYLMHLNRDSVAGIYGAFSRHTSRAAGIATHVIGAYAGDWAVAPGHSDTCGRLVDAVDPHLLEESVASGLLDHQHGGDEAKSHDGEGWAETLLIQAWCQHGCISATYLLVR